MTIKPPPGLRPFYDDRMSSQPGSTILVVGDPHPPHDRDMIDAERYFSATAPPRAWHGPPLETAALDQECTWIFMNTFRLLVGLLRPRRLAALHRLSARLLQDSDHIPKLVQPPGPMDHLHRAHPEVASRHGPADRPLTTTWPLPARQGNIASPAHWIRAFIGSRIPPARAPALHRAQGQYGITVPDSASQNPTSTFMVPSVKLDAVDWHTTALPGWRALR